MSLYGLLKINPEPSMGDIEEAFDGNLCRCTGYRAILDSARTFVKHCSHEHPLVDFDQFAPYDAASDVRQPFPARLAGLDVHRTAALFASDEAVWFKPGHLADLLKVKSMLPQARLVGGNSELGVEMNARPLHQPNIFIYVGDLSELRDVKMGEHGLHIGVNITLTELIETLNGLKKTCESHHKTLLDSFLSQLQWFASRQVRNFATLAGNISTGSPISDLNPIFVATNSLLTVCSQTNGKRTIKMRDFFLGLLKNFDAKNLGRILVEFYHALAILR